jgi:uncharacterized protein YecE (DUF72 family)
VSAMVDGADIRVGTSGWSYPSGRGAWTGIFYPAPGPGRRRVDELAYYADRFDTVEVNSTFYRTPSPETTRRWVSRTPPGFDFSLKLYQKFTHPDMFQQATGRDPYDLGRADIDQVRVAIEPIARAGKLGALLAQFPPAFHASDVTRDYVAWLLRAFSEYTMAVELRHRSWSDAREATTALLGEHGAAWVQIDEPKFRLSIQQDLRPNVPGAYYLRLHGRNAAAWWRHDHPADRYDYLYSAAELEPVSRAVVESARHARKLRVYLNNHFEAKAAANAVILRHQLGQQVEGNFEREFVERYPEVRGIVRTEGLF